MEYFEKNFDMDEIDEFFFYIDNLGENFQIKDFIHRDFTQLI